MFSSLKVRLQSILNPFQRRSVSICVESKAKKIDSKRDKSQTKRNTPQEIDITPKKKPSNDSQKRGYDEIQTTSKQTIPIQTTTRIMENRNDNKWLDFVSDIESAHQSDRLLLPNSQELPKKPSKESDKQKRMISKYKSLIQEQKEKEEDTIKQPQTNLQANTSESLVKPDKEHTLIHWLEQNKPEYFMIKMNKQSKNKTAGSEIKKKRLEEYQKRKKQQAKGKFRLCCIICEEQASPKESIHLACTHRIHKTCAELIKWKPKMKCNLCERKSVNDLAISNNRLKDLRRTQTK